MKKLILVLFLSFLANTNKPAEKCPKISEEAAPGLINALKNLNVYEKVTLAQYLVYEKELFDIDQTIAQFKQINPLRSQMLYLDRSDLIKSYQQELNLIKNDTKENFQRAYNIIAKTLEAGKDVNKLTEIYNQIYCRIDEKTIKDFELPAKLTQKNRYLLRSFAFEKDPFGNLIPVYKKN